MKHISSIHNPSIKRITSLQEKSRERRKAGLFVVEGLREIQLALDNKYAFAEIYWCPEILDNTTIIDNFPEELLITEVTREVYNKIAYRSSTEGILAIAKTKNHGLEDLTLPKNPLILVAEAPEKPGNIGALLRTADAAGVDAFILANARTDLYNPNIIRSSVGGIFTQAIAMAGTEDVIAFLSANKIKAFSAILQDALPYQNQDFTGATAIVVGTEADGLTEPWRTATHQNIIIPMRGEIDSMNVSVAAGILIFEARRQRGFKK